MRYTVRKLIIHVIGNIWQPGVGVCAMPFTLSDYDLRNIGEPTRDNVEDWLTSHAGDFSRVLDFYASLEVGNETVEIPWHDEESECTFGDCMYPCED